MNTKMKRFIGILLSLVLVMGMMPGMSLTAYADGQPYVKYLKQGSVYGLASSYHEVTSSDTDQTWNGGWYVVRENATISRVEYKGPVDLILCDGATLTLENGISGNIQNTEYDLNIYAQSTGGNKGKLIISEGDIYASDDLTIYGGKVTVSKGAVTVVKNAAIYGGDVTICEYGISAENLTIDGGDVTVENNKGTAIQARNNVVINGGNVTGVKYSPCQGQSNLTPWKTATNHGRLQMPANGG